MKIEEKKLIENLFYRLNSVEKKSEPRNELAEKLINSFIKVQQNAPYYMTQTILIQETVLKKLNKRILELEEQLLKYKNQFNEQKKNTGFLSNIFKKNSSSPTNNQSNNRQENSIIPNNYNNSITSPPITGPLNNSGLASSIGNSGNSFLGNALQTAVGVAGGMVVGNMLMNLFTNKKPEEEILNSSENLLTNDDNFESLDIIDSDTYNLVDQDHGFLSHDDDFFDSNDSYELDSDNYNEDSNDDNLI